MATIALDLDGTLITCEPRQSAVLRATARRFGVDVDLDAVWECKRAGGTTLQGLIQCGVPGGIAASMADVWRTSVESPGWLAVDRVLPEVTGWLLTMRRRSFTLDVLTARSRPEWVVPQLANLGLLSRVDSVTCVPPAEAAAAKADHLGRSGAVIFVGDTESDASAARQAGCRFAGVATGQRHSAFLRAIGGFPVHESLATVIVAD